MAKTIELHRPGQKLTYTITKTGSGVEVAETIYLEDGKGEHHTYPFQSREQAEIEMAGWLEIAKQEGWS
jgi:hypothetical protein